MIWTNLNKLPAPLAQLVSEDLYYEERKKQLEAYCLEKGLDPAKVSHFSASDLIRPPQMRVLTKRYGAEVIVDVAMHIYRVLGTAIHTALRLAAVRMAERNEVGYIPEKRLFTHFKVGGVTVVISGEPDLITPDDWLHDYKVTGIYGLDKGVKIEWEQATNIYAWLRSLEGKVTKGILITFILRDWMNAQVVQEGYPPAPAQSIESRLWTFDEQQAFVEARVKLHLEAEGLFDDDLPECKPEEMWEKPESWAVIRDKGARAAKVYRGEDFPEGTDRETILQAATADATLRNEKPRKKGEEPYVVQHRPGERTRCDRFCEIRAHCRQYKEYAAARFSGNTVGKEEGAHHA